MFDAHRYHVQKNQDENCNFKPEKKSQLFFFLSSLIDHQEVQFLINVCDDRKMLGSIQTSLAHLLDRDMS